MSVRYGAVKLQVPPGFKQLLENLSREVLREQPKNIPRFAAAYFNRLIERREQGYADGFLVSERIVESATPAQKHEETVEVAQVTAPESAAPPPEETRPEESKPEVQEEEEMPDLNDPDVAKAATLIQASFRGFKTRKSMTPDKAPTHSEIERLRTSTDDEPSTSLSVSADDSLAKRSLINALIEEGSETAGEEVGESSASAAAPADSYVAATIADLEESEPPMMEAEKETEPAADVGGEAEVEASQAPLEATAIAEANADITQSVENVPVEGIQEDVLQGTEAESTEPAPEPEEKKETAEEAVPASEEAKQEMAEQPADSAEDSAPPAEPEEAQPPQDSAKQTQQEGAPSDPVAAEEVAPQAEATEEKAEPAVEAAENQEAAQESAEPQEAEVVDEQTQEVPAETTEAAAEAPAESAESGVDEAKKPSEESQAAEEEAAPAVEEQHAAPTEGTKEDSATEEPAAETAPEEAVEVAKEPSAE